MTPTEHLASLYSLQGRVAVVTGGSGVLGSATAMSLAMAGARVGVLGRRRERLEQVASEIQARGGEVIALTADVLDRASLNIARKNLERRWEHIHVLINAAGGNLPVATVADSADLFGLSIEAFQEVVDLNLTGTLLPSLVFGEAIAKSGGGSIVNVSSMASARALTRVAGYGAAKAAVENLTRWLAVELGRRHRGLIRVNAIAPGFFIGEQNRSLLLEPDGSLTARGQAIIDRTPAGRFGEASEVCGALLWLCSPSASFVNGVVLPIDGGFSAFSGV
ncbi:MAG: SDR family oxidoreductase [Candidatus Dormibacteraeota bacterium]|nr:SDR family oxidoreductase [Candidatus Dormibacteraeota bacterium]